MYSRLESEAFQKAVRLEMVTRSCLPWCKSRTTEDPKLGMSASSEDSILELVAAAGATITTTTDLGLGR